MLLRPCILVLDAEHANSISSRKLVLETAKYNVITAYSCLEAVATLERFPAVDALVLNGLATQEAGFPELAEAFALYPDVKVILVGDRLRNAPEFRMDATVESFAPQQLLAAVQQIFPSESRNLIDHDTQMEEERE